MRSIDIAVAKTHKYASRDSGDTVEMVERPTGGVSVVLVDGQGSGAAAKSLSMMVSSKVVGLLKEGVRDGAVARGAHDFLHAYRHGRVSSTLDILSVDLASSTIIVTRNSEVPYLIRAGGEARRSDAGPGPIGLYRHTRPAIEQHDIEDGLLIVLCSDGIASAGERAGVAFDPLSLIRDAACESLSANDVCDRILDAAIAADNGRPNDDMSVIALCITTIEADRPIRRQRVVLPIP